MLHGGDLSEARARHGAGDWLDLSTGINPHAWPVPPLDPAAWQRLPEAGGLAGLILAARGAYQVPGDVGVVAAPGTQALIQWLPRLAAPGGVAVVGPTYAEHEASWRAGGCAVADWDGHGPVPPGVRHAVVVNPNNPDGRVTPRATLASWGVELNRRGGWLVVDESFADMDPAPGAGGLPGVVALRSFGKFHGLAGVRLGFAIADPAVAERVAQAVGPWAVSGPAIAIGTAALRDRVWADATRAQLAVEAQALDAVLDSAGFQPAGGTALYRLVRHEAAALNHGRLARQSIWVRRFDWDAGLLRFGLPPTPAALHRLQAALHASG